MPSISSTTKTLVLGLNLNYIQPVKDFFTHNVGERFELARVSHIQDGLDYLKQNHSDLILLDLSFSSCQNLDAVKTIQEIDSNIPIIILLDTERNKLALEAIEQGVQDCLFVEDITERLLEKAIFYAIERQKILQRLNRSKRNEQKLARQAKINHILAQITQNIHSSLDLDIILQTAVENVHQFLPADIIFIAKIDRKNKLNLLYESVLSEHPVSCNLSVSSEQNILESPEILARLSIGEFIIGNGRSLSVSNEDVATIKDLDSILLLPIIADKQLWGVLCGKKSSFDTNWIVEEIKLLDRVAIQLGIAIQQSELYQKLENLAILDGLTKIANRRKFDDYINSEWHRLAREKAELSLIMCDIDYFKLYNDTYGHQAGDRCLQQVARAIGKAIKRPADLVARYDGEEFAIILPHTNIEGAEYLARQICLQVKALQIPHINSPVDIYITLSLGVAGCIPTNDIRPDALIAAADRSLYQAKELGRNRVVKSGWLNE